MAATISADMGSPLAFARKVQVGTPLAVLASYVELLAGYDFGGARIGNALVVREPAGVVGAITPWNYPLHQVVAKVAAALAAGCTVVLKPSEVAPLAAYALASLFHETGLPAGVFNLVSGTGLPDADLATAVKVGMAKAFVNAGQTCNALTRMLVHADSYDEAVALAADNAAKYTVGHPSAEGVRLGPLVSAAQPRRSCSDQPEGIPRARGPGQNIMGDQGAGSHHIAIDSSVTAPGRCSVIWPAAASPPSRVPPR